MSHPYGGPPGPNRLDPYGQPHPGPYGQPGSPQSGQMPQPDPYGHAGYAAQPGYPVPQGYGHDPAVVPPHVGVPSEWGTRVAGSLLDGLIMSGAAMVVLLAALVLSLVVGGPSSLLGADESVLWIVVVASYCVGVLGVVAAWFWGAIYRRGVTGQTFGQKIMKIKTVSEETGQPLGVGGAFVRHLCHFVDGLACNIGYLAPLWEPRKQTWADKIVRSVVVSVDSGTALPPSKRERKQAESGRQQPPGYAAPPQW